MLTVTKRCVKNCEYQTSVLGISLRRLCITCQSFCSDESMLSISILSAKSESWLGDITSVSQHRFFFNFVSITHYIIISTRLSHVHRTRSGSLTRAVQRQITCRKRILVNRRQNSVNCPLSVEAPTDVIDDRVVFWILKNLICDVSFSGSHYRGEVNVIWMTEPDPYS